MTRLAQVGRRLASLDTRTVMPAPKTAQPLYDTSEHRAWRDAVIARAGARCEATTKTGDRCRKAAPAHRMFADHIRELADGGARLDLVNGQCLCGSHHAVKTARERAARR